MANDRSLVISHWSFPKGLLLGRLTRLGFGLIALGRLLLLGLLQDDLDDAHLRQSEGAAAVVPLFVFLELLDPLGARQHAAVGGTARAALQGFVDRHVYQGSGAWAQESGSAADC